MFAGYPDVRNTITPARFWEISVTRKNGSARLMTAPTSNEGNVGESVPKVWPGGSSPTWPRSSASVIAAASTSSSEYSGTHCRATMNTPTSTATSSGSSMPR